VSTSPLELDPFVVPLVRGRRVLDLGCGYGHWGHLLMTHLVPRAEAVGVDAFAGNVGLCRRSGAYAEVVEADALDYLAALDAGAFDTVLALELIEHLTREDGLRLLGLMERAASEVVVLSTPNFACLRPGADTMTGYNEHEHHLSTWSARDFRARGYAVMGVGHNLERSRVRGVCLALRTFPTLDGLARGWCERHPGLSLNLLAARPAAGRPAVRFRCGTG